jgi:hypothetical protein
MVSSFVCFAQSDRIDTIGIGDRKLDEKIHIPFAAIKIIDARYDQSNVGCVIIQASSIATSQYTEQAVFPDSLRNYLPLAFNNIVDLEKNNTDTLVLLVKQFRLTDQIYNDINQTQDPESILNISTSFYSLNNGRYYRLFSIDNILSQHWKNIKLRKRDLDELRSEALFELLCSLFTNHNWQKSSTSYFTYANISDGLYKRFNLPVLRDTASPYGLYKTYNDFKNNHPDSVQLKLLYNKNKLVEVRDMKNKMVDLNQYWGLSDGRKRYIVFRGKPYELLRNDRSFRFKSYRRTNDLYKSPSFGDNVTTYGLVPSAIIAADNNIKTMEYFYLNMDTGEVYLEELFGKSGLKSMQKELLK